MNNTLQSFLEKNEDRSLTVGILGLGYVGLPLALRCAEVGFRVIGFDIDPKRVSDLNSGVSPIKHIQHSDIVTMVGKGFEGTTEFARSADCDALIICVPTPLNITRDPDLSYVIATMDAIAPYLRTGQMISLESTTWPGTTHEILTPYFNRAGLTLGEDCFLLYSPEREDPGNERFTTQTIPKIAGGETPNCLKAGVAFYETLIDHVVQVSSTQTAEMTKLLENIHRSVNIGLVNEMKIVCEAMGLDVFEVIDAAKTKPFGFTAYYPGPGIGGHCIPIDPFYLTWKAREFGVQTRFIEIAGEVNASMPDYVVNRTMMALNERGLALSKSKILVIGLAYKRDVDDVRESPSVDVMERLRAAGATLDYHDPNVPHFPKMRVHQFNLSSVPLTAETLKDYDAVVLLTDHSDLDYALLAEHAPLLVDTRGRYRGQSLASVVRA